MPLPQPFDMNEIFFSVTFVILIAIIVFMPKRFPLSASILLLTYGTFIGNVFDMLLATPPYDLFDVFDTEHYDLFDLPIFFYYGCYCYLLIYSYDRLHIKGLPTVLFVILGSAIAFGYEWIMTSFKIFTYKGWQIAYSFTVYLFVVWSMVLFYQYIVKKFLPAKIENKYSPLTNKN